MIESNRTQETRLRVLTDKVRLQELTKTVPRGEYAGYIDWSRTSPDEQPRMIAVQIVLERTTLDLLGVLSIPSMHCEVLRYLLSGDIEQVE